MFRRKLRDLGPGELVTELHPYHEWSEAHTSAAVGEIAELVRYLNHATQHPEALPGPAAAVGRQVVEAGLGERLDALGREIEAAGFAARRLTLRRPTW
ncbi:hypothetical protein ACQP2F_26940 [Actinoplanes sp. CA-030573]|uniref:hypothetical protein n=1 Tax=Actinoplanes sp. CA-030573 TaxID=3239898 RepID=UPI003D94A1BF